MRKITILLINALMVFALNSWGQSTTIDFEIDGAGYTPSATEGTSTSFIDVFNRSNPNIGGNSTYMWAVEDITLTNPSITLDQIDLTGATSFTFSMDMVAHHYNDWDDNDELLITYSVDGGAYQNLMWIQNTGEQYNDPAALDTDFDGNGECAFVLPALTTGTGTDGCVVSSNTFQNFSTSAIPLSSNTTLDITLQFNGLTSTDEGIYLDNIIISLLSGGNNPPVITGVAHTPSSDITSSTTVSVSSDVTDSDGTVAGVELHWGTSSGVLSNTINMSNTVGDTYATDTDIPAQADGTTVYYEVYALDDDADDSTSPEYSYTVNDPATTTLPYNETYDSDLGECYTYSVSGATKEWHYASYGSNGYADMNGYNSGDTEIDWLILPGINFDSYTNEIMSFDTWWQHATDDANNYLKLYYSTNYPGIGDPTSYSWTELSYTQGATQTWTSSGDIDLSAISGTSVYIGFKYQYNAGNYRHWEIDNISIAPSVPVDVTFQVNMTEETVSGNGVHIAGSMQGWDPATTELLDPDLDGIYTVTLSLMSNVEYQFKYINGNTWADEEDVPAACEASGSTNRYEVTTSPDYSIPVVCFGSCVDCGGAYYDITFQVDMQNETVSGDGVYLAGTFTNWGTNAIAMTQNGSIWSTTVSLQENSSVEYKFVNGDPNNGGAWENNIANRQLTVPSATTTLDLVCFDSNVACPVSDFVIINEVDADQDGTDANEFIELYDGGVGNTNLSGLVVVLFNGSDDQSYNSAIDLDGYSTDANGYFVIGSSTVPNVDYAFFTTNGLQNGADAVALYIGNDADFPNDTPITTVNLLDAIVYDTNDGDDAGLLVLLNPGEPQINEGGRGSSASHSNQRLPNGSGGQRNTSTYDQAIPTPGAVNAALFTDWTGNSTSDWFDAGSWSNGLPTAAINAVVPDMTGGGNPNPVINGSGAVVNDLVVQSLGELTIGPAGQLTVNGSLSNQNGAAGIVLQSDATGQGSLLTDDVTYMTVQTYLTADKWHMVSAPVTGDTAGVFLGVYLADYTESDSSWTYIVPVGTQLPIGQGYMAWALSDFTANHVGVINVSDVSANLSYTDPHPHPLGQGWNMVGNPFTSAVTWNTNWTLTNLDATMYIYDGNQYKTMNTDGITGSLPSADIPVGQGIWVHANASNPSITIPASERLHSGQGFYKNENTDLHFSVQGNAYSDEMLIQFNDNASADFDSQYDAYKLRGVEAAPQLYMVQNGIDMATNSLPFEDNLMIPVNLEVGADGNYTFTSEFDGSVDVILEDLLTGEFISLYNGTSYAFYASSNDASERFVLHFGALTTVSSVDKSSINVYSNLRDIYVEVPANTQGDIFVYNMMGQNVAGTKISGTLNKVSLSESAYYVVKVISNEQITSKKVFIK
jgi:hypothetical protein